ncbi:MAG TPA: outer membrane beta-barrel protein [Hyphomicrobiaceae bacterium]|nr:outer membrane beta-barrel protein [Hyphomicrobiaceae bacterium]
MNFKMAIVLTGLALVTAAAPARAQSFGYAGGLKDMAGSGGIPVPAPVPIPVYKADYYIRGDIGFGMSQNMGIDEEGFIYGQDTGGNAVTVPGAWEQDDASWPMTFGVGVGRYWTDNFRTDVTLDWVRQQDGVINGSMAYTNLAGNTAIAAMNDKTTKEAGVFLLNAYYDFGSGEHRRFTPYIGGGIGFGINILDRKSHITSDITGTVTDYDASNKSTTVTFAATAMAGFTYDLGNSTLLDINYRYLHIGGSDIGVNIAGGRSTMSFDSQNEHQIRAGLRFNID